MGLGGGGSELFLSWFSKVEDLQLLNYKSTHRLAVWVPVRVGSAITHLSGDLMWLNVIANKSCGGRI